MGNAIAEQCLKFYTQRKKSVGASARNAARPPSLLACSLLRQLLTRVNTEHLKRLQLPETSDRCIPAKRRHRSYIQLSFDDCDWLLCLSISARSFRSILMASIPEAPNQALATKHMSFFM